MAKRFYRTDPSPDTLRAIWDRLHDLNDQLTSAQGTITKQADTITTLQTNLTATDRDAKRALVQAGRQITPLTLPAGVFSGGGGPAPGPGPPPPPPGGTTICSVQPLSAALPGWLSGALAGLGITNNCWNPGQELALEGTFNANDFTIVSGLACSVRGRIFHQGNHGLWTTCNGHPDAQYVADLIVDVVVTNSDGSVSWGWVPH